MKYFFVDFYPADDEFATFVGGSMLTSYVAADSEALAVLAVMKAYPDSHDLKAYEIPEIPLDCPYLSQNGVIERARMEQPCCPPEACKTHGRCWTHSDWE